MQNCRKIAALSVVSCKVSEYRGVEVPFKLILTWLCVRYSRIHGRARLMRSIFQHLPPRRGSRQGSLTLLLFPHFDCPLFGPCLNVRPEARSRNRVSTYCFFSATTDMTFHLIGCLFCSLDGVMGQNATFFRGPPKLLWGNRQLNK